MDAHLGKQVTEGLSKISCRAGVTGAKILFWVGAGFGVKAAKVVILASSCIGHFYLRWCAVLALA